MSIGQANCAVCGGKIVYFQEAQTATCELCGKEDIAHCICEHGHYVCDTCHRSNGVEACINYCLASSSKNPIEIAQAIMDDRSIYPNGPEHHTLVGAALLTAYHNAGGAIDLEKSLAELKTRSLCVPGGTCGFWGTCGAAVSAGQMWSIASKSSPMTSQPWGQCQKLTSNVLASLATYGGPRCCKRTGFLAIKDTVAFAKEIAGVEMELPEHISCHYFANNDECLRARCPFFPEGATHPLDI